MGRVLSVTEERELDFWKQLVVSISVSRYANAWFIRNNWLMPFGQILFVLSAASSARLALTSWNGKLSVVCSDAGRMRETALDVGAITSLSVLGYVEFSVNTRSLLETRGE